MSEVLRSTTDDERSRELRESLEGIRELVEERLRRLGGYDRLSPKEKHDFKTQMVPHVQFEFEQAEGIHAGMPIAVQDSGMFIAIDEKGKIQNALALVKGDLLIGITVNTTVHTAPSSADLAEARAAGDGIIHQTEESFSPYLVLLGTALYRDDKKYPLGEGFILVPLVHGTDHIGPVTPEIIQRTRSLH